MNIVIDANVYSEYYKQCCHNQYCHDPIDDLLSTPGLKIFFDESNKIATEWENLCCKELTRAVIIEMLDNGIAVEIPIETFPIICKKLRQLGFPQGKDRVYIQTAKSAVKITKRDTFLITQDIDFFDPKLKNSNEKTKAKTIRSSNAPICKYLRKNENVHIKCIENFLTLLPPAITTTPTDP